MMTERRSEQELLTQDHLIYMYGRCGAVGNNPNLSPCASQSVPQSISGSDVQACRSKG